MDPFLVKDLNPHFSQYEVNRVSKEQPLICEFHKGRLTIFVQEQGGRGSLKSVNTRRTAGPDGIPGQVHNSYFDQLVPVPPLT